MTSCFPAVDGTCNVSYALSFTAEPLKAASFSSKAKWPFIGGGRNSGVC